MSKKSILADNDAPLRVDDVQLFRLREDVNRVTRREIGQLADAVLREPHRRRDPDENLGPDTFSADDRLLRVSLSLIKL